MTRALAILLLLALSARDGAAAEALPLLWGADQEGGGPYVYPRDDDPARVTGFEVELAERLGQVLGREPIFFQGPWDRMPDLLATRKVDIVLNGYEWNEARAEAMEASIPYYVYGLQLLGRGDDTSLASWDDLGRNLAPGRRRRVGVLTGSAAEVWMRKLAAVEVVTYDGNTDAMREVETGKLDATLQDTPIASFYASRFPGLRRIGDPVGRGYYVVYAAKGNRELITAINAALAGLILDGEVERIDRRYGIWDDAQAELTGIARTGRFFGVTPLSATADRGAGGAAAAGGEVHASLRLHGLAVVRAYGPILLASAAMTVVLALCSFPLAVLLGIAVALGRIWGPRSLRAALTLYVEFLRGTPLMLQLFFIFFLLPEIGINVPAFATAVIGLAVNYSAYESEIYRAGLEAIPGGQMEAALALGMSRALAVRRILLPQAFRIVIPPAMNDFIALFKDTSVVSVITIVELTKRFSVLSQSTQATVELMAMTALLYLAMSYPLAYASRQLERRLGGEARA